ncbi:methylated-DNA--[protein]-cysteine S-methyltransferase [Sphingomonas sp. PAMC26645]|uniref:methylated-DNA--[protein]-cysteine S-methyltransferase n=1 Tax=Sphingomonas sp. PAMC26645 TaxID=2565555 RepID=UPI00109E27D5|nr:methylated-DNA--[protein]-cysteine S-methyltransferase [Sphingomonas sp. PAMC26645]QCB41309.1 methylated-DNA--[protein]-cysteine S-methyltransferase [Sphingomonas sp. PAMC26645]
MYARDAASIATPIGLVRVTGTGDRIDAIDIGVEDGSASDAPAILEALRQIDAYFAGRLTEFDLPLAPSATPRGADLRQAIVDIAYGTTASYGALAKAIGSSPRAIGQACASNPFPIIVPCHRILGAGGALGAYSAGEGPITKSRLLDHERPPGGLL